MNIFLEKFVKEKFKTPGASLDLGCGKGYDTACLKHIGWKALGVDKGEADLNKPYKAKNKFDLVYSNYVLQFIDKREVFVKSCYDNLKKDGWLFIHTFGKNDALFKDKGLDRKEISELLKKYFKNIEIKELSAYDNQFGHKHWHKIMEVTAQKN